MPDVDPRTLEELRLYGRHKATGALPFAGGLMDQPEWALRALDRVEAAVQDFRRREAQERERETWVKTQQERLLSGRDIR